MPRAYIRTDALIYYHSTEKVREDEKENFPVRKKDELENTEKTFANAVNISGGEARHRECTDGGRIESWSLSIDAN